MSCCSIPIFRQFPELRIGLFGKEFSGTTEDCALALGFQRVSKLHQIHGNIIHTVKKDTLGFETQGDGLITDQTNHALSVRWADCHGFVIYEPNKKVMAVLHAGWRGMAVKAITALYMKMQRDFGIDPHETFVGITPSICVKCYRFEDAFKRLPEHLHPFIRGQAFCDNPPRLTLPFEAMKGPHALNGSERSEPNGEYLDLQAAADAELDSLGVPREHRERHPACTKCGNGFWSWRGDKREDARNYLVVGRMTVHKHLCSLAQQWSNGAMYLRSHAHTLPPSPPGQLLPLPLRHPAWNGAWTRIRGGK